MCEWCNFFMVNSSLSFSSSLVDVFLAFIIMLLTEEYARIYLFAVDDVCSIVHFPEK